MWKKHEDIGISLYNKLIKGAHKYVKNHFLSNLREEEDRIKSQPYVTAKFVNGRALPKRNQWQ